MDIGLSDLEKIILLPCPERVEIIHIHLPNNRDRSFTVIHPLVLPFTLACFAFLRGMTRMSECAMCPTAMNTIESDDGIGQYPLLPRTPEHPTFPYLAQGQRRNHHQDRRD